MKKTITKLLRIGVFTLTLGGVAVSQAEPQAEKGDAGQLKDTAEVFDCKKDVWTGSHSSATDADLQCIWWGGGQFTIKCVPGVGLDCSIAVFRANGDCWARTNASAATGAAGTETLTIPFLPAGICYIYTGHYKWWAFETMATYTAGPLGAGHCDYMGGGMAPSPTGTFYGCQISPDAPIGATWETTFQEGLGWEHAGIPFQQEAQAGEKPGKTKSGGQVKVMSSRKKSKFFMACVNPSTKRGATGVQMRGVSKKKFKQKYIDTTTGENLTADLIGLDFCKNYDGGFKQTIKCVMSPKGRFKKMKNVKSKCVIDCQHDGGAMEDTKKVKFYANLSKRKS